MVRLRRPPEWGVEPVPASLRVLRTFDLFVLWSSLGAGLLVLAAGALLVTAFGLSLWEAAFVSLGGSLLGSLLLAGAGHHGSQAGVPTMVSLRPVLGRVGSYAPTALNILQLLGWTAFELLVMAQATAIVTRNFLGPWTAVFFVPTWGMVTMGLGLLGLSALPLLAILVDETDNAFADVYSAAVSVQNLSVRRRQATTIVGSTLIGIAAAWYLVGSGQGIGGPYETFLLLIGGLFVPLLGVVIAETFVVRRSGYSPSDFFQAAPRWRWPAFASWFPGTALYFVIVLFGIPIGATLPSFALAAGLHVVFSKVEQGFARSSPLVSSGDP